MELSGVVGDERQLASLGLSRDQHVVRTDERSLRREVRPDLPGVAGVLLVELQHRKLKRVHPGEPFRFLAGADGKVAQVIDGVFGRGEAEAALSRIAGP